MIRYFGNVTVDMKLGQGRVRDGYGREDHGQSASYTHVTIAL